mgnify:CR=1 FL=1
MLEFRDVLKDTYSYGAHIMGLRATDYELGARSWERRDEELKTRGTTQANEDRDEDQGDKMGQRNNTRLMCQ